MWPDSGSPATREQGYWICDGTGQLARSKPDRVQLFLFAGLADGPKPVLQLRHLRELLAEAPPPLSQVLADRLFALPLSEHPLGLPLLVHPHDIGFRDVQQPSAPAGKLVPRAEQDVQEEELDLAEPAPDVAVIVLADQLGDVVLSGWGLVERLECQRDVRQ